MNQVQRPDLNNLFPSEGQGRESRFGGFRVFFQTLADLFWPPVCAVCSRLLPLADESGDAAGHFCPQCYEAVEFLPVAHCSVCGRPFYHSSDHVCGDCLSRPQAYRLARSALAYAGPVARSISLLKYYGDLTQVKVLADLARPGFKEMLGGQSYDAIIPLPISKSRRKERGFNQTEDLAAELFASQKRLLAPQLLSRPETEKNHQARLSAAARRKAIKGSFTTGDSSRITGADLLLFDDVFTTGATVSEAADSLLEAGAARVDVFTIARTILLQWR